MQSDGRGDCLDRPSAAAGTIYKLVYAECCKDDHVAHRIRDVWEPGGMPARLALMPEIYRARVSAMQAEPCHTDNSTSRTIPLVAVTPKVAREGLGQLTMRGQE
jgi:hypothetical protein